MSILGLNSLCSPHSRWGGLIKRLIETVSVAVISRLMGNAEATDRKIDVSRRKPHFVVLDGLRGVSAFCVVIFHMLERVLNPSKFWIGHGFLAVDFFFCLSGFVLGYAYDDRIATMGLGRFLKTRLVRLHPLVVFGAVLGLIAFYVNPFGITSGYGPEKIARIFVASVLLVPYGAIQERGRTLFSLNAPSWSLFWEYIANLAFGLVLYRIRRSTLVALTVIAATLLCWIGHKAGNLAGGPSASTFAEGGARMVFSFCAGLLVYRMGWCLRTPIGFAGLSLLLILAFVMPYTAGAWVREAAVVMVYFPLLLVIGAGATIKPVMERLCRLSGDLSYPLYMTHYALIWIWGDFASRHRLASERLWSPVVVGVVSMVAFAWMVLKLFDQPMRTYLRKKMVRQSS